eukprot:7719419-Pyramimonas_sp.AAC.1
MLWPRRDCETRTASSFTSRLPQAHHNLTSLWIRLSLCAATRRPRPRPAAWRPPSAPAPR